MPIDAPGLTALIDGELAKLSDSRVVAHVRALLIEPTVEMRDWDYGRNGDQFPCWTVLRHAASNTGIAYCEHGFGPRSPWGIVSLDASQGFGMDSGWFTTFLEAYFDSFGVTELPIWRVFKTDRSVGLKQPITDEGDWNTTWEKVMALRKADPENQYDCETSIQYERE